MKKLIVLFLSALMAFSSAVAEEPLCGDWTPSADPTVTEELRALFEKGTETLTGVSYIPVAYLGSRIQTILGKGTVSLIGDNIPAADLVPYLGMQAVAGTHHAFLCRAVTAYPGSLDLAPAYAMVYLYEDLSGSVSILSIADFDIGSLCTY